MKFDVKKILLPNLPYVFVFWFFNRMAEGYRLAEGADMVAKAMGAVSGLGTLISQNPLPSFHPRDLLIGAAGAQMPQEAPQKNAVQGMVNALQGKVQQAQEKLDGLAFLHLHHQKSLGG